MSQIDQDTLLYDICEKLFQNANVYICARKNNYKKWMSQIHQ